MTRQEDDDDRELFRRAMSGVIPLEHDLAPADDRPRPAPVPEMRRRDDQQVLVDMMSDGYEELDIQPGDELHFCRPGIQHSVYRKLRQGQFRLEAELDLHGLTADEARRILVEFLLDARAQRLRHVRIIHGKGLRSDQRGPVLKARVNKWLRQREDVLAFTSARPVDGGTGAVYVLLKRS
ncbi:MAG: Smr/MutS family protein [Gammaproteobacteria bacterium]